MHTFSHRRVAFKRWLGGQVGQASLQQGIGRTIIPIFPKVLHGGNIHKRKGGFSDRTEKWYCHLLSIAGAHSRESYGQLAIVKPTKQTHAP